MPARDVEVYLAKLPPEKRATLEKVRKAIRVAAPGAEEGMSYGMPAFIQGKSIAGYAAGANHCAYYPMSGAIVAALQAELAGYDTSKGAIRFPIGKPLPATLVRKLVKARVAEIAAARSGKSLANATNERVGKKAAVKKVADEQKSADVVAYLRDVDHPLEKEIERVRDVLLRISPAIREGIKWNAPSFRTDKEYFATFHMRARDSVQLILHLGAEDERSPPTAPRSRRSSGPGSSTFELPRGCALGPKALTQAVHSDANRLRRYSLTASSVVRPIATVSASVARTESPARASRCPFAAQ